MPFCIRCSTFNCNDSVGLISLTMSPSSSVRPVEDADCSPSNANQYIPGPSLVNVQINAYAFAPGEDKWLDSRCKGSASAGQTNIQRYDYKTDKWWFIPSKAHRAQINGQIGKCFLGQVFFEGVIAESQVLQGTSITTELGTQIGAQFSYTGHPLPVSIPDLTPYTLDLGTGQVLRAGFINSVNINVDFPSPATITYNFDFPLDQ